MAFALFKNKKIGLKVESTAGTKENLSSADYGLEVTDLSAVANTEVIDKNTFRGSISASPSRIGKVSATVELSGELKNSGVVNTKPRIDTVLQASRMVSNVVKSMTVSGLVGTPKRGITIITGATSTATALIVSVENSTIFYSPISGNFSVGETVSGGTFSATVSAISATNAGFVYNPSSTPATEKTITLNVTDGGIAKNVYGSASTFKMSLSTSDFPKFTASFSGIADTTSWGSKAAEVAGIVYESHAPAIVVNAQIKIGDDFAPVTSSVELDLGNSVSLVDDLNSDSWYKYALVNARSASGTINILADLDESANLYSKLFAGQTAELTFSIGHGAGTQIDIILPAVQYTGITESDSNSCLAQALAIKLTGTDNELLMWFR